MSRSGKLLAHGCPPQLDRLLAASPETWRAALRSASEIDHPRGAVAKSNG
jgi:hypothetical protein